MTGWDIGLLIANIGITIISGIGASKSIRYFRKSRNITIYAQGNQALGEIGEMLQRLPDVLIEVNSKRKGVNIAFAVRDIGKELSDHLNVAMDVVSSDYSEEFRKLLKKDSFDISYYINSLIDGTAFVDINERQTLERTSFDLCQERLREMQEFLKKKIAETEESLK